MMKKRYLFPLINTSAIIGCVLASIAVPPETSLKLFAVISVGAILVINIALVLKIRSTQKVGYVARPPDKFVTIVTLIASLVFVAQVVRGIIRYWRMP